MRSTSSRNAGSRRLRGCGSVTSISREDAAGIAAEHQDAVAHQHRLLDVVRDQDHALDRHAALGPQIEEVGAQRLGGQHVERRERLVHQQDVRDARPARARSRRAGACRRTARADRRTRSRPGRSGRWPRASACGSRPSACAALRVRAPRSRTPSATETARSSGTPSRCRRPARRSACPGRSASPALGSASPAIRRSSVDLPEPERPSRPTIWPCDERQVHALEHQQFLRRRASERTCATPVDLAAAARAFDGTAFMSSFASSGQSIFAFGVVVQRPPEHSG